jgi:hypothetical protein
MAVPVMAVLVLTMLVSGGLVMRVRHGCLRTLVAIRLDWWIPTRVTTL